MGGYSVKASSPNPSKVFNLTCIEKIGSDLWVGTGNNVRLCKWNDTTFSLESTEDTLGGATVLKNIRESTELPDIVSCTSARIGQYDIATNVFIGTPGLSVAYAGDHLEMTATNKIRFGKLGARVITEYDGAFQASTESNTIDSNIQYGIMFSGDLYVGTADGALWKYNGTDTLTKVANAISSAVRHMVVFSGAIYMVADDGKLYTSDGASNWVAKSSAISTLYTGYPTNPDFLQFLFEHSSSLYCLVFNGFLLKWNGTDDWIMYNSKRSYSQHWFMTSYSGDLLAGVTGTGDLLVLDPELLTYPTGIASSEAFGSPSVAITDQYIHPDGVISGEVFGIPHSDPVQAEPDSIASAEAFSNPSISTGNVTITPTGIASLEAVPLPSVLPGNVNISPDPILTLEAFGFSEVGVQQYITLAGIPSEEDLTFVENSGRWQNQTVRLGDNTYINSLIVFEGKIWGGSNNTSGGKLLRWDESSRAWEEMASLGASEDFVLSLAIYNSKLYLGTGGQAKLYSWNGATLDLEAGRPGSETGITKLVVHNSKLYGSTEGSGLLVEWDDVSAWNIVAPQIDGQISMLDMIEFEGDLYTGSAISASLYKWNGTNSWIRVAPQLGSELIIRSLIEFQGDIYAGTQLTGELLKWNKVNAWESVGAQLDGQALYTLFVYNNILYAGTAFNGKLFQWNIASQSFSVVAESYFNQTVIGAMVAHNGRIYAGTGDDALLLEYIPLVGPVGSGLTVKNTTNIRSGLPRLPGGTAGDLLMTLDSRDGYIDLMLGDRDLERDGGFETAVLLTLISDKLADSDDELPDKGGYLGGYWGDSLPFVEGDQIGWKGWLLQRSKAEDNIIAKAKEYLLDGFQWMLDDGIVKELNFDVTRIDRKEDWGSSTLYMTLKFIRPEQENILFSFYYNWEEQLLRRA